MLRVEIRTINSEGLDVTTESLEHQLTQKIDNEQTKETVVHELKTEEGTTQKRETVGSGLASRVTPETPGRTHEEDPQEG